MKNRFTIPLLVAATTLPLFFIIPLPDSSLFGGDVFTTIARGITPLAGYVGISFLVWNVFLGIRSTSHLLFVDQVQKLITHRFLGTFGVLLIFLHPLSLLFWYGMPLSFFTTYNFSTQFDVAVSFGKLALFGVVIMWLSSVVARRFLRYHVWKSIHFIAYPVCVLAFMHVPTIGSHFSLPGIQVLWGIWAAMLFTSFITRIIQLVLKKKYEIISISRIAHDTFEIQLKPLKTPLRVPEPGSYVYLQQKRLGEEHPFSVAKFDIPTSTITIAVKTFGVFTQKLSTFRKGKVMYLSGPFGSFTKDAKDGESLFIAGGIGITPFIRHLLTHRQSTLIYAARSQKHAAYRDELAAHLRNKLIEVYEEGSPSAAHHIGRITKDILKPHIRQGLTVYL